MAIYKIMFLVSVILLTLMLLSSLINGYIMYCPCMGRFGNQADHFLGSLAFAKALNRTLVLPPWVEYQKGLKASQQVPFDTYFDVDELINYHNVILMSTFMDELAPRVWPVHKRISFCYMERKSFDPTKSHVNDCHAKDGNPFGPFWDTYKIDFVGSEFYSPLHFDVVHTDIVQKWNINYPTSKWPVIAFTGAPASFPVQFENRRLQKYLKWNDRYTSVAKNFITNQLPSGAFIGLHLRNGIDWVRACEHTRDSKQLFASPQCLGYHNEHGQLFKELCLPSLDSIVRQIKRLIKLVKRMNPTNEIRSLFVASDSNHLIPELKVALNSMNVSAHKLNEDNPHLDLAILGMSNYFIGNCISSFSAFVKRERDVRGLPSYFWSFPKEHKNRKNAHEEL